MDAMKIKLAAKKGWVLAKKFWWAILLGMLFMVAALVGALTRNAAFLAGVLELLEAKGRAHEEEITTLQEIHAAEVNKKNKRLVEHDKRLLELEKEFTARGEKLVDESYNDSEKLSREIADTFGLKHG